MGRPTKLNKDTCDIILEKIEGGNYLNVAARCAGVSYKVFREWMVRGTSSLPADAPYRAFRLAVNRARATAEADAIASIQVAAKDPRTWQAAAWFLERSFSRRWAKRSESSPTPPPPKPLEQMSPDEFEAYRRQVEIAGRR
jgi:hypothetical protein